MISYVIPLVKSYFSSGLDIYWFYTFIALAFLAAVPCILRSVFRR